MSAIKAVVELKRREEMRIAAKIEQNNSLTWKAKTFGRRIILWVCCCMWAALDSHNCYFDFDVDGGAFWWSLICQILSYERRVRWDAGLLHCSASGWTIFFWLSAEQEPCANNILRYLKNDRFIFSEIMDVSIFCIFVRFQDISNILLLFFSDFEVQMQNQCNAQKLHFTCFQHTEFHVFWEFITSLFFDIYMYSSKIS